MKVLFLNHMLTDPLTYSILENLTNKCIYIHLILTLILYNQLHSGQCPIAYSMISLNCAWTYQWFRPNEILHSSSISCVPMNRVSLPLTIHIGIRNPQNHDPWPSILWGKFLRLEINNITFNFTIIFIIVTLKICLNFFLIILCLHIQV